MITKILKINDFGIFKDFTWDISINEFKQRNLIYGWNYSGKTTISKLFNNLEKRSQHHFPFATYCFETKDGKKIDESRLEDFVHHTKVFNANYVNEVFSWDKEDNEFEAIQFYLGEQASIIQPKIDNLNDRWIPKISAIKNNSQNIISVFEEYNKENGKFSKQATLIRKFLNDQLKVSDFNKKHFATIVDAVRHDLQLFLLNTDELHNNKLKALDKNEFPLQKQISDIYEDLWILNSKVKNILADSASVKEKFIELDENEEVFNWVQRGLSLHKKNDKCKFCENDITTDRFEKIDNYFSEKLQTIQKYLKLFRENIIAEQQKIQIILPHESEFANHLRSRYLKFVKEYVVKRDQYIIQLKILLKNLERKEKSIFKPIVMKEADIISFKVELAELNTIINEHNEYVANYQSIRSKSLQVLLYHYVAEYLISEDYAFKLEKCLIAKETFGRCNLILEELQEKLISLEAKLKDTVKGKKEINDYLEVFLGRKDIQIDIVNSKFVLKRGINLAKHFSEGEKTAIAFSYFLTELKSLQEEDKLKNYIIYFDDPISSLDSNHIFQVRSLLQFFFSTNDHYLQLFISTHNFEFFSVMLDSNLFKKHNQSKTHENQCPYYLINRTSNENSTIKNLPKALRSHKSEYAHLFSILHTYNKMLDKEDFEYRVLLPNTLRRFLELYTLFKYPKGFSQIDERVKMIFTVKDNSYHNVKLLHWFSHQNQFEKISQHDNKLMQIDGAISDLMTHIEINDELHWRGLLE